MGSFPRERLPRKIYPVTSGRQRDSRSSRRHAPGRPKIARLLCTLLGAALWHCGSAPRPPGPQLPALENVVMTAILMNPRCSCCASTGTNLGTRFGAGYPSRCTTHWLYNKPRVGTRQVGGAFSSFFLHFILFIFYTADSY